MFAVPGLFAIVAGLLAIAELLAVIPGLLAIAGLFDIIVVVVAVFPLNCFWRGIPETRLIETGMPERPDCAVGVFGRGI